MKISCWHKHLLRSHSNDQRSSFVHQPRELASQYNPSGLEAKWYKIWEEGGFFSHKFPDHGPEKQAFCMVIPPPNVTGSLHLGHALNHTIQDILARYHRMKGRSVLWLPGTDHAGIATQNVVERLLAKEGKTRQKMGRENFEERVWQWKEESGSLITQQQRQLGESVDWDHESFTLDEHLNQLVNQVFIRLYQEGLIYRAKRMINWCPVNRTALSNIEVEYKGVNGNLYYIQYPVIDSDDFLLIATTRPETLLGDEALAVHPNDPRYKGFVGKHVLLPLMQKKIPVIADEYVDETFGTGVVKITPAHDPNDFEVGRRHKLPTTIVIDPQGRINENGSAYAGLSREEARKKIVSDLKSQGLLKKVEKYQHQVGHSYRSGAAVEPLPSTQWFVNAKELAKEAIKAVHEKKVRFIPQRWEKIYFEWMYNIQDWCISRQLWWGHRIPAWYDKEEKIYIGLDEKNVRETYGIPPETKLKQDEDVLDTWFSSALWPFSTLWSKEEILNSQSWPDLSELHKRFYPNHVLVTGFDIIFFWVARMIMMGTHFMNDVPFREVYIHGLVRDADRQKMSKSKGNVVNPLEKMDEYGTDAFRFFMISILPEGKDIVYDESRLKGYQAFCNKVWNTARYLWMNQPADHQMPDTLSESATFSELDIWMIEHFNSSLEKTENAIRGYRFSEYAQEIYDLTWKFFCDHYIELAKVSLKRSDLREAALYTLNLIFQNILKLLHPIMPFITEELYSYWRDEKEIGQGLILVSEWPIKIKGTFSTRSFERVENMIQMIHSIRNLRGELSIPPGEKLRASFSTDDREQGIFLKKYREHISLIARLSHFEVCEEANQGQGIKTVLPFGTLFLDIAGKVDFDKEKSRLQKEDQKIEKELLSLETRMKNPNFLKKAPKDILNREKDRIAYLKKKRQGIKELLTGLD